VCVQTANSSPGLQGNDGLMKFIKSNADSLSFFGVLEVGSLRIGELQEGQKVSIKLKSHPYEKYGLLMGEVSHVSDTLSVDGGGYRIEVAFPGGLTSTQGRNLRYFENMDGEADIVLRDRRVIEYILWPLH